MGLFNLVADYFAKHAGNAALKRNIEADPQILTGDRQFDVVVADIFKRVAQEDPKVLKWDEKFQPVVGLYDQATKGDIPEDLICNEPEFGGFFNKMVIAREAMNNMDNLVDQCRRAEHSKYRGMPREDAIVEFKIHAAQLYAENEQPFPVPFAEPQPHRDASPYSSDTQFDGAWSDEGSYSSGYYTPVEGAPPAAPLAITKDGENGVDGIALISSSPGNRESGAPADQIIRVGNGGSDQRVDPAEIQGTAIGAPGDSSLGSQEGWTSATTLKVIAGTTLGFGLVAGFIFLYKKLFRGKRNPDGESRSRIHARSWSIADVDVDVL